MKIVTVWVLISVIVGHLADGEELGSETGLPASNESPHADPCAALVAVAPDAFSPTELHLVEGETADLVCGEGGSSFFNVQLGDTPFKIGFEIFSQELGGQGLGAMVYCFVLTYQQGYNQESVGVCPKNVLEEPLKNLGTDAAKELAKLIDGLKDQKKSYLTINDLKNALIKETKTFITDSDFQERLVVGEGEELTPANGALLDFYRKATGLDLSFRISYVDEGNLEVVVTQDNSDYTTYYPISRDPDYFGYNGRPNEKDSANDSDETKKKKEIEAKKRAAVQKINRKREAKIQKGDTSPDSEEDKNPQLEDSDGNRIVLTEADFLMLSASDYAQLVAADIYRQFGLGTGIYVEGVDTSKLNWFGKIKKFFGFGPKKEGLADQTNDELVSVPFDRFIVILNDIIERLQEPVAKKKGQPEKMYYRLSVPAYLEAISKREENKEKTKMAAHLENRDFLAIIPVAFEADKIEYGAKVGKLNPNKYFVDSNVTVACGMTPDICKNGAFPFGVQAGNQTLIKELQDIRAASIIEGGNLDRVDLLYWMPKTHRVLHVSIYQTYLPEAGFLIRFISQFNEEEYMLPSMPPKQLEQFLQSIVSRVTTTYKDHIYSTLKEGFVMVDNAWLQTHIDQILRTEVAPKLSSGGLKSNCFCFRKNNGQEIHVYLTNKKCKKLSEPLPSCVEEELVEQVIRVEEEVDNRRIMWFYDGSRDGSRPELYSGYTIDNAYDYDFEPIFNRWVARGLSEGFLGTFVSLEALSYPEDSFKLVPAPPGTYDQDKTPESGTQKAVTGGQTPVANTGGIEPENNLEAGESETEPENPIEERRLGQGRETSQKQRPEI